LNGKSKDKNFEKKEKISKEKGFNRLFKGMDNTASNSSSFFDNSISSIIEKEKTSRKGETDSLRGGSIFNKRKNKLYNDTRSTNKNFPHNQDEELNYENFLARITRENKRKKIPFYNNLQNLNNYLIRDFKIGEYSNQKINSIKKYFLAEKLYNFNEKKRKAIKQDYLNNLLKPKNIYDENDGNSNNVKKNNIPKRRDGIIDIESIKQNIRDTIDEYHTENINQFLIEELKMNEKNKVINNSNFIN